MCNKKQRKTEELNLTSRGFRGDVQQTADHWNRRRGKLREYLCRRDADERQDAHATDRRPHCNRHQHG